jgi:hypothetical protein
LGTPAEFLHSYPNIRPVETAAPQKDVRPASWDRGVNGARCKPFARTFSAKTSDRFLHPFTGP